MLYRTLQVIVNIFYRIFYRLEIRNIKNVPKSGPIILAPNHTNAFIDPVISCMLFWRRVQFFARGDVFKGRIAIFLLRSMNISPMYRMQEGYSEVKKNDKTFEECKNLLSKNRAILIFPEGICVKERRLRKLKKGLARILFMAAEEFDFKKDIKVIPVGMNYEDSKKIRSKLCIDFGKPVSVTDYIEKFKVDKVRTINEFTEDLEPKMREVMVVVEDPENDTLMKGLEEMFLHPMMKEKGFDDHDLEKDYLVTKEIAEIVNHFQKSDIEKLNSLRENVVPYIDELHARKLRDHLLRPESILKLSTWRFVLDFFVIWFGTPIYWMGMIMNHPPYIIAEKLASKKAKNPEFHPSIEVNLTWILWFIYYGSQLLTIALVFRSWPFLGIYGLIVPFTLFHCIRFDPMMRKILGRWRLMRLVRKEKAVVERLMFKREEIKIEFESLRV